MHREYVSADGPNQTEADEWQTREARIEFIIKIRKMSLFQLFNIFKLEFLQIKKITCSTVVIQAQRSYPLFSILNKSGSPQSYMPISFLLIKNNTRVNATP